MSMRIVNGRRERNAKTALSYAWLADGSQQGHPDEKVTVQPGDEIFVTRGHPYSVAVKRGSRFIGYAMDDQPAVAQYLQEIKQLPRKYDAEASWRAVEAAHLASRKVGGKAKNPRTPPDKYGDRYGYHVSLSYGGLPSKAEFQRIWDDEMGGKKYPWTLRGADARLVDEYVGDIDGVTHSGVRDADAMYALLEALRERDDFFGEEDDNGDNPGSFASSILETLGIEWI